MRTSSFSYGIKPSYEAPSSLSESPGHRSGWGPSRCNWIVATSWPTYLKNCTKKTCNDHSQTQHDDSDTQQTELETENLGEIYPAIITPLNDLSGPKAAKFTGPRGKKHLQTLHTCSAYGFFGSTHQFQILKNQFT